MATAIAVELARVARKRATADRAQREQVLQSARAARRESRRLRDHAFRQRDRSLDRRWTFWAAGSLPEPPTFIPASWDTPPADGRRPMDAAISECRRTAATILRVATGLRGGLPPIAAPRMPAVIALCEAAADRLEDHAEGAATLLGSCARACDELACELESAWPDERGIALGASCRAAARAVRLALLRLHEPD